MAWGSEAKKKLGGQFFKATPDKEFELVFVGPVGTCMRDFQDDGDFKLKFISTVYDVEADEMQIMELSGSAFGSISAQVTDHAVHRFERTGSSSSTRYRVKRLRDVDQDLQAKIDDSQIDLRERFPDIQFGGEEVPF